MERPDLERMLQGILHIQRPNRIIQDFEQAVLYALALETELKKREEAVAEEAPHE